MKTWIEWLWSRSYRWVHEMTRRWNWLDLIIDGVRGKEGRENLRIILQFGVFRTLSFLFSYNVLWYNVLCFVAQSCPTLCGPVDCSPPGSSVHCDSPDKNTRVGGLSLLCGIFPTQGSNQGLLHCRWILYQLSYQGRLFRIISNSDNFVSYCKTFVLQPETGW